MKDVRQEYHAPGLTEADLLADPVEQVRRGVDAATEKAIIDVLKGLREEGRTVIAVHHDLSTVAEYFDRVFIINTTKVAEGTVAEAFTQETLQSAYGGRLAATQIDQLAAG